MKRVFAKFPSFSAETARDIFICLSPFLLILLAYGSFHHFVPYLYRHTHYTLMSHADQMMFGNLPTATLQHWLWHGYVTWYDYVFYIAYNLHYILPVFLAVLVYKLRRHEYVRVASTFLLATFSAFVVFILYPTAPPWMASQAGYIVPITRIFDAVYSSMGIQDFSALYNHYAPNPVAAMPSIHAAYAILFTMFVYRYFGKRWGALSLIYPFLIIVGVVYMGEHYMVDVLAGMLLAFASYMLAPVVLRQLQPSLAKLGKRALLSASSNSREQ